MASGSKYLDECPYGADNCPKTSKIEEILNNNSKQLALLTTDVSRLSTTVRNAGYILALVVTVLAAVVGALII